MPIYSIIIPVYNVAEYLEECLNSILAQKTASEYEVILVDDGSTDRSGAICDEYSSQYPNFQVIHQKNQKLSCARNAGFRMATGKFVIFFDSDDIWKENLLSEMDCVISKEADMTLFLFESFGVDISSQVFRPAAMPQGESGPEYLEKLFAQKSLPLPSAWTYMYRREFLSENQLLFEPGLESTEDFDFNMAAFSCAKKVISVDQILYLYRIRAGSLSLTPSASKAVARLRIIAKWYRKFPKVPVANHFAIDCLSISMLPMEDAAPLISFAEANQDILDNVSGWRMRLARFLYRSFGFYRGSHLYLRLIDFKHLLLHQAK